MPMCTAFQSQQLQTLCRAIEREGQVAVDSFLDQLQKNNGAPLVEPIDGNNEKKLVTFLWRADTPIARLSLISLLADREHSTFTQLGDTDLWVLSCAVGRDVRATYQFFPESEEDVEHPVTDMLERFAKYRHDPLNPHTYVFEKDEEDPDGFELTRSVLEMPDTPTQPWNAHRPESREGRMETHRLRSEVLDNERRVWIYTPAGYDPNRTQPYDVLVMFDGTGFATMSLLPTILDNLIASGVIPPLVALMPCSISQSQRLKELLLYQPFNEFLAAELLPWAHRRFHLSRNPSRVIASGASAGGLAAAYAAFEHPELFGKVLSLSGAFAFAPGMLDAGWKGEHEYLAHQVTKSDAKPISFFLSAGTLETRSLRESGSRPNLVAANRHLRTVLEAKGYPVQLSEFPGGHDMISWQGVIPEGLSALLGS